MPRWAERCATLCCAALLAATPAWARATSAAPIRILTSDLPPLSMEHTPAAPGALYEMVEELVRRAKVPANIEFVPWKRAVYLSTSVQRSAIFPLTRSAEREPQYRWLAQLYHEHFLFLALKGGNFDVAEPVRHKQRRIGILRGSLMLAKLREAGYVNIVEASSVDESLRFLKRGIVDAVFGDRDIYRASLAGRMEQDYVSSTAMHTTTTWLAGSRDFTDADVLRFQKAMKDMVDDGSYAAILKRYDLAPGP